ncbi:MAG: response regulator [Planctomycetes bacterium]|nr:response regulator [Planctomycetota bacterium]
MSSKLPRLVVPAGLLPALADRLDSLKSAFEVVEVESAEAAHRAAGGKDVVLLAAGGGIGGEDVPAGGSLSILEHIGQGVGIVGGNGRLAWANRRLRDYDEATQKQFVRTCGDALDQFNQSGEAAVPLIQRPGRRFTFTTEASAYEAIVSIASVDDTDEKEVCAVVGTLWDISSSRRLQARVDAIDTAGAELLRIDTDSVARLDMAQRLRLLEEKIRRAAHDVLGFDSFEVRLTDRQTRQLELVFSTGLTPLKIGEVIFAREEDNGISGYVASTGQSYICRDAMKDARYREGLHNAASSLTVPLQLHDEVIGVFNVESDDLDAFDENDLHFAQIFGRYVAMAMHILDLLVVERYTTNEQITANFFTELNQPLTRIADETAELRSIAENEATKQRLDGVLELVEGIRRRLQACTTGPKSLIGADQEEAEPDPLMQGKRVILADNEPTVREAIGNLLRGKGCEVAICAGGAETIDLLREREQRQEPVDLVISDIRMPDRNGYEVFRTAKEIFAGTPVILMTGFGYDPHHSIVRASQEGLHSFLFKPLQASQLLEAVTKAFGGVVPDP